MEARITDFHFFLKSVSQKFSSIAIFNADFKCLNIKTNSSTNSIGLMNGLKALKNFFPWDESLAVIHNDPMLGCGGTNRIQFLFSAESFHFAIEESFDLPWNFTQRIIKIPPIPVFENRRINTQLLENLTGQPDCPQNVHSFILSTLQKIELFQTDFKSLLKANKTFSNKETHKEFLNAASQCTLKSIKSKTYSSAQIDYEFGPQSTLKLKTSTSELGIRIDFQGTTNHSLLQVADSATDSICFNFFADYFQFSDLMNEATYSLFQITKPTQSFVNSKNILNKIYSDYCGPDLIIQALLDCVSDRSALKPYMAAKAHVQILNTESNLSRQFAVPNAKPIGSMGVMYGFEVLLTSRPTSAGQHIPDFAEFEILGIEAVQNQNEFRSTKAKETNDYQNNFHLKCLKPVEISFINPNFPIKIKSSKNKLAFIRPTVSLNGLVQETPFATIRINPGDALEIKSGYIEQ